MKYRLLRGDDNYKIHQCSLEVKGVKWYVMFKFGNEVGSEGSFMDAWVSPPWKLAHFVNEILVMLTSVNASFAHFLENGTRTLIYWQKFTKLAQPRSTIETIDQSPEGLIESKKDSSH